MREKNLRLLKFLAIIFIMALLLHSFASLDFEAGSFFNKLDGYSNISKKWIVITSVNYPTDDVKRLASLSEWEVVVVADTKTPQDWDYPGVHFLSVEKQLSLGLTLPGILPFKTYTRKNVGYLYAIMNGAEWIYDTDDDNKPYGLGLEQFDYGETVHGLRYTPKENLSEKLFNPYRFFGYKDMWPRGFPLEYISDHSNGKDRLILCREMKTAAVQQGIVHKDPDVDAIYRLIHADRTTGLNVTFNKFAPPVLLEAGTYSPWNSQNTLFHRRAFFTMFLPTTVEFRVTDIWRSYFAQKMLHLTGESVAFYPVNAVQIRNAHDFLKDFDEEIAVYTKSGKIVQFLDNFTCSSATTQDCFMELADGFASQSFNDLSEIKLMKAWIADLNSIGYKFPPLANSNNMKVNVTEVQGNCRSANIDLSIVENDFNIDKSSRSVQKVDYFNEIVSWCDVDHDNINGTVKNLPSTRNVGLHHREKLGLESIKDTVLVLISNYAWRQSIGLLQRLYSPYFATTVLCGTYNPDNLSDDELKILSPVNYVNLTVEEMTSGYFYYDCVTKVRNLRLQNVKGYFFVSDDAAFHFWHSLPLEASMKTKGSNLSGNWWNASIIGEDGAKKFVELMEGKYAHDDRAQATWKEYDKRVKERGFSSGKEAMLAHTGHEVGDLFYLSADVIDLFANMSEYLVEAKLFVELAFNKIFLSLDWNFMDIEYTWFTTDKERLAAYNSSRIGMHPIKLSSTHSDKNYRKTYCSTVISAFYKNLFEFD